MLSEDQKRELAVQAAEQLRRQWGVVKARPLAAALDDIRARFIEEGWFGRPLTQIANDVQRSLAQHELYGRVESEAERLAERADTLRDAERDTAER
jgi:hypothetical protein